MARRCVWVCGSSGVGKSTLATAFHTYHGWLHYDADLVVLGGYTADEPITLAGSEPDPARAAQRPEAHVDAVSRWLRTGDGQELYALLCEEIQRCRQAHSSKCVMVAWAAKTQTERDMIRMLIPDSEFIMIDAPVALRGERALAREERMAEAQYGSVEAYLERCCKLLFGVELSAEEWRCQIRSAPGGSAPADPGEPRTHTITLDALMSEHEVFERACQLLEISNYGL